MKKILLAVFCFAAVCAYATEYHVAAGERIQTTLSKAKSGDVVIVANGTFHESLTVQKGVTLQGSGNTILCGQKLSGARGINNYGTVRNMIIELFDTQNDGSGIYNHGGVVEYCVVRGCRGKEAAIWNEDEGILLNCLMHNNEPSRDSWPNSGGFYNPHGRVINCTSACNFGNGYSGWHSESAVFNSVSWGNGQEEGFSDPAAYIESSTSKIGSGNNATNSGFESKHFPVKLSADNLAEKGPNFVDPTPFVGAPKTEAEIAAMRQADFRIYSNSPLVNKGKTTDENPTVDLLGTSRPKQDTIDIGCYEYDPKAEYVLPKSVSFYQDTLTLCVGETGLLVKQISPKNASVKVCKWESSDPCVTVKDGVVTGVAVGRAKITVTTLIGMHKATAWVTVVEAPVPYVCPEVEAADLLDIKDYTIPSYIPMWVAREAARTDSSQANLDTLATRIAQLVPYTEPYCVVANINGDPKTQMAFCWFTNDSVFDGQVQLVAKANATEADFNDAIAFEAEPTRTKGLRYAVSNSGLLKATGMKITTAYRYISHKVLATDLTPGTTYSYRVGYPDHWSQIYSFQTEEAKQDKFSFLLMSDSHLMNKTYVESAQYCAASAVKAHPEAKFLLFPGDFVEDGDASNSEWEWERWFEQSMQPVLAQMPVAPTDGNHDDSPNYNYTYHFNTNNEFNQETLIKPQFQGITYSFVYGDVLFMVYSKQDYWRGSYNYDNETSLYLTRDLGNWFRRQVAAHPEAKWRVACVHFNIFSGSGHQEDECTPMFRTCMLPIMKELEIDVVLQGHDHCYEVIGPVNPDTRTPILSAITDREEVAVDKERNMTGKKGGTFCTDDGTLYFIGATCGSKRYSPYSKEQMEANYSKHKVENYFDLFTGMFGQPGAPTYTCITATADTLNFSSFTTNTAHESTLFNSFNVVRTREHSDYEYISGIEDVKVPENTDHPVKFISDGQMYIATPDAVYSLLGQKVK